MGSADEALDRARALAGAYLDGLAGRPVRASGPPEGLRGPLPAAGADPAAVIEALAAAAEPGLVASAGPRYFGFVTGGALPAALAADWLTAAWDQNACLHVMSPAAAVAEEVVTGWVRELLRLPAGVSAGIVTGAQMANVTCLAAARHAVLARAGWDVEERGLHGAPPVRVLAGEEAHVTAHTALRLLGIGRAAVELVAADDQGRMRPDALASALQGQGVWHSVPRAEGQRVWHSVPRAEGQRVWHSVPRAEGQRVWHSGPAAPEQAFPQSSGAGGRRVWPPGPGEAGQGVWHSVPTIVCAQAGNVNTGAFDPLAEVTELCREHGAWCHVDGAFGLWAAAAPARRHLVAGAENADSWAVDAHKWLNVPYDGAFAFVADRDAHLAAMRLSAPYLTPAGAGERNGADWAPEASRRARAFPAWAALRSLGRDGVAEMVERCCALAARMADRLAQEPGVEILNDVVLNQVLVRIDDDDATEAVARRVQEDGTCWLGTTRRRGISALRISVSCWATTEEDVDRSVAAILAAARG